MTTNRSVRPWIVLGVRVLLLRIRDGRVVELVVAVVLAGVRILFRHESAPTRRLRTRTRRGRERARRGRRDRPEARRGGGPRALERERPGPPSAASRRPAPPDPDHARRRRPRRARRSPALVRAPAGRVGAPPLPGREDRNRAADRERLLLRLRLPRADPRGGPRADRGGDPARAGRGAGVVAAGGLSRGGARAVPCGGRAVQARAPRGGEGPELGLHAG